MDGRDKPGHDVERASLVAKVGIIHQNRVEIPQRSTLSLCGGVISFLSEAREYRAVKRRQFITLLGSAV
ncbi:MAG: hypothetical protein ABWZ64_16425, partial [Xanthobacteraceae bacterium]